MTDTDGSIEQDLSEPTTFFYNTHVPIPIVISHYQIWKRLNNAFFEAYNRRRPKNEAAQGGRQAASFVPSGRDREAGYLFLHGHSSLVSCCVYSNWKLDVEPTGT